jgi:hypothetical protein
VLGVRAFPQLVGGESIAVGRERLLHGLDGVGRIEPCSRVEVLLDVLDLLVDGFRDKEIDAVYQVLDKALGMLELLLGETKCDMDGR